MKPAALFSVLLFVAIASNAQLTLTPQIGFEQFKTSIGYNQFKSFSPLGWKTFIKTDLRLDYRAKKGHGLFATIGTNPSAIAYSFTNPSNALNNFSASTASLQWKLEGGYQYTTKKISFKTSSREVSSSRMEKKTCSSFGCGARKSSAREGKTQFNMRLQPFVGLAYLPIIKKDFLVEGNTFQYNAGNWKTGIVTGLGFELGSGRQRIATLNFYYTKGIGNLSTKTIATSESGKTVINSFSSKASGWAMTFGVPLSLAKSKKSGAKKTEAKQNCRYRCDYYKSRCPRLN